MNTILGPVLDDLGQARKRQHVENQHGAWETRSRHWATPSSEVRQVQGEHIPVCFNHDESMTVGQVVYLERAADGKLWAAAHVHDAIDPEPGTVAYWSARATFDPDGGDVEIEHLAIVERSAQSGLLPLTFLPGALDYRGCTSRWRDHKLSRNRVDMLERAATAIFQQRDRRMYERTNNTPMHQRTRAMPLLVRDAPRDFKVERISPNAFLVDDERIVASRASSVEYPDRRPPGELRWSAPYHHIISVS